MTNATVGTVTKAAQGAVLHVTFTGGESEYSIGPNVPSFVQIGVSITPGWTVLTRIPSCSAAHSIATALANRRTPPFVAQ